jgi:23S rRNA (cytosine1962-C5)-methyltransferase
VKGTGKDLLTRKGIFERNDVPVRELEGLTQHKGFLSVPFDTRHHYQRERAKVPRRRIENGQKTGYFLDQQDNRRAIQHIVNGPTCSAPSPIPVPSRSMLRTTAPNRCWASTSPQNAVDAGKPQCRASMVTTAFVKFEHANAFDVLKAWAKDG